MDAPKSLTRTNCKIKIMYMYMQISLRDGQLQPTMITLFYKFRNTVYITAEMFQ